MSEFERERESEEESAEQRLAGELTVDSWLDSDPAPEEQSLAGVPDPVPEPTAKPGLWDRLRRAFGSKS